MNVQVVPQLSDSECIVRRLGPIRGLFIHADCVSIMTSSDRLGGPIPEVAPFRPGLLGNGMRYNGPLAVRYAYNIFTKFCYN